MWTDHKMFLLLDFLNENTSISSTWNYTAVNKEVIQDINYVYNGKGKGKEIPLQALTDPEGSRRLRLPDFKTVST
jgi:hypothetical protein